MDFEENAPRWHRLAEPIRGRLVWGLWFATWLLLLGGLFERSLYGWAVALSALHALFFGWLFHFRAAPFPVQVRLAYLLWVTLGTYVPGLVILMYITTVGLATNLFLNYCPLARLLYVMPWNRSEALSCDYLGRVFLTPPSPGKFVPPETGSIRRGKLQGPRG